MKLYYSARSVQCRKVRIVAAELALPLELHDVDVLPGRILSDDRRQACDTPVPTLVDGQSVVWSPPAILQHLAERGPDSALWPRNSGLRVDISRWLLWDALDFVPAVQQAVRWALTEHSHASGIFPRGDGDDSDPHFERFHLFAAVLDAHLRKRAYLVGSHATLADYAVVASLTFADQAPLPLGRYAALRRWRTLLEKRPPMRSVPVPAAAPDSEREVSKGPCHY